MGSATARRFALVAALVLLAPLWCRPGPVVGATTRGDAVVRLITPAAAPGPAVRRPSGAGSWLSGSRVEPARGLQLAVVVALLALLVPRPGAGVREAAEGASSLGRRRHAISLRAPPLLNRA